MTNKCTLEMGAENLTKRLKGFAFFGICSCKTCTPAPTPYMPRYAPPLHDTQQNKYKLTDKLSLTVMSIWNYHSKGGVVVTRLLNSDTSSVHVGQNPFRLSFKLHFPWR
ncbi:hypothetical protein ILYODFUR_036985 [Ilyodon furcidens]|uniref:Uncharacterized protein n=1 Tax=Ilyodon furcidens TaxID=33524 RepID=A0ABV0UM46_9TELE